MSEKAIARALAKRKIDAAKASPFNIEKFLFSEQLAFVRDPSPNKLAVCSRRSGKTIACAADLIDTALSEPNVVCIYITLSRNNSKKIIWRELKKINREYSLDADENLSELSMTYPNKSIIYLSGAKDTNEIEKFRGLAIKKVYIDEAQSFRQYIQELINDILAPALMDYAGTLCLTGTPSPIPTGFFHDCIFPPKKEDSEEEVKSSWAVHSWTFFNNPFIVKKSKQTHQQMLDRELKRRGVKADDPSIQREWFGRWVQDKDSLLIHYNPLTNHFTTLPANSPSKKLNYIMGIDLGYDDADAIAIIAWSEDSPVTYLVEEIVTARQGITELVTQIESLTKKYEIDKIVMDQGGLGKKIAEEIRRQKHIPVQPADKALKMQNVAFLNDALRTGRFMAKSASKFAQDSYLVEIDRDKSRPDKIVVSTKYHSDIIDAVLYAFKESPAYTYQAAKPKAVVGSMEWAAEQSTAMFEAEMERMQQIAEMEKMLGGDYE